MVLSSPTYVPSTTRHVVATATMSHEKHNGIPKRRPVQNINTRSPRLPVEGKPLPKLAGTPGINGVALHRTDGEAERAVAEEGVVDQGISTPVKPLLSSNITPRSGSRKARAETASPTPNGALNGTPNVLKPMPAIDKAEIPTVDARPRSGVGLRISNSGRTSRPGSVISDGPSSSVASKPVMRERNSAMRLASPETTPKFFHADDVKASIQSKPTSELSLAQGPSPGCTQATDENVPFARTLSSGNNSATDEQRPKFFYANDANEAKSPPLQPANGYSWNRPPLQTIHSTHSGTSPPRAPSPLKEEILPQNHSASKPSPRRHTRLVSNGGSEVSLFQGNTSVRGDKSRRASLSSPHKPYTASHARSSSVNSAGPSPPRKMSTGLSETHSTQRARTTSLVGESGALPHSANPPTTTQEPPLSQILSPPHSPAKSPRADQSKLDYLNELAANARRERKVLDLEISNSSLLAINRTLEREMRKQTAELRRFRRLSRSGRLSVAPSRSASSKIPMLSETTEALTGDDLLLESDQDDDDMEDLISNLSSTSAASHLSSSAARAGEDRFQDPKRIELDLAAHRALLLASQKLNMSIKRCLSHSESLIESAKTALASHAEPPEPENLGPRVLTPDEVEDETFGRGQGLLSPSHAQDVGNPWERSLGSSEGLDAESETPEYSRWGVQRDVQPPVTDLDGWKGPELPNELPTMEAMDAQSEKIITELDELLPKPQPNNKYRSLEVNNLSLRPGIGERRVSSFLSLDGLDDEPELLAPPTTSDPKPSSSESSEAVNPASFVARAGRGEIMKSPEPKPGEAGFRGSMQGLGHYLQAFSLFGPSQQA